MDWTTARKHLKYLQNKSGDASRLAGILQVAAQGGVWTGERRLKEGRTVDEMCSSCGGSEPETLLHKFWTCPALKGMEENESMKKTRHLVGDAIRGVSAHEGFWRRGLTPYDWTFGKLASTITEGQELVRGGIWKQEVDLSLLLVATDASGG